MTAGNANGAPLTSEGQLEGIAAATTLPVSEGQLGSADPMALMQALQALPKVSGCHTSIAGNARLLGLIEHYQ